MFHLLMQFYLSTQKPGIPRAALGGAAHGGGAGLGGAWQHETPEGRFAQKTTVFLAFRGIEDKCPEQFFERTNKGNAM